MTYQRPEISLETRLLLMEKDVELLKLRDTDLRVWQDSVNRNSYKIESLEKSLDDARERVDDLNTSLKSFISDAQHNNKGLQETILKKMEELAKKPEEEAKPPKTSWQNTIETTIKIVFLILVIAAGFLGIKIPGVGG